MESIKKKTITKKEDINSLSNKLKIDVCFVCPLLFALLLVIICINIDGWTNYICLILIAVLFYLVGPYYWCRRKKLNQR